MSIFRSCCWIAVIVLPLAACIPMPTEEDFDFSFNRTSIFILESIDGRAVPVAMDSVTWGTSGSRRLTVASESLVVDLVNVRRSGRMDTTSNGDAPLLSYASRRFYTLVGRLGSGGTLIVNCGVSPTAGPGTGAEPPCGADTARMVDGKLRLVSRSLATDGQILVGSQLPGTPTVVVQFAARREFVYAPVRIEH